ncbi:Ig-like domain-containing protein [Pseudoalteromonas sp.]|uniref:Ig-like domain-containing protein n=1 Tax=Pseudoalteromonas sp. TaxID=53249 RepID=UPI0035690C37
MLKSNKFSQSLVSGVLAFCSFSAISASVAPAFTPNTIGANSESQLTLTLSNSSGTNDRDISFTANLPADIRVSTPSISSTNCGATANVTAVDGASSFSLLNAVLANGESCQLTIMTTSSTVGTHTFTMPAIEIGSTTSSPVSTNLIVATDRPSVSFSLDKSTAVIGENIRATLTFDNSAVTNDIFSLTANFQLPNGLTISDFPDTSNDCAFGIYSGGNVSSPGDSVFSVSGFNTTSAAVASGSTCSISQNIKASNTFSGIVASGNITGVSGFSTIELGYAADNIVINQPSLSMNVLSPVSAGESTKLEFKLRNFERISAASKIDFTVDLNAITPSAIPGINWSSALLNDVCGNGDLSGSGSALITFSNGSLAAEESCTFIVDINIPAGSTPGAYKIASSSVLIDSINKGTASTDLIVVGAPTAALRFTQSGNPVTSIAAGDTVGIEFTFTDTSNSAVTDLQAVLELTGGLPFPITATLPPNPNPACGAGSSVSLISLGTDRQGLQLSSGNLAANGSCTFTVDIAIPNGLESGSLSYTMTSASATVNTTTVYPKLPSFSVNLVGAPSLKVEMPKGVLGGDSANAVFTLSHRDISPASATGINFTLDLNTVLAGLTATNLPLTDVCGSGSTVAGSAGETYITLSGASLAPGASCNFNMALNIPNSAIPGEFTATTSAVSATVDGLSVTGNVASNELVVTGLNGKLEFLTSAIPGGTVTARYTFSNVGPTDLTALTFTHNLNDIISGTNYSGSALNDICGSGSSLSGTTFLIFTGGNIQSGQSCSFDIEVNVPVATTLSNYNTTTSSVSYNIGSNVTIDPLVTQLSVDTPLRVTAAFTTSYVTDNSTANLEYTLANIGSNTVDSIAFTDNFGAVLSGALANISSSNQCNGTLTGSSSLNFSGGSILAGESCKITVGIDLPNVNSQTLFTTVSSSFSALSNSIAISADAVSSSLTIIDNAQDIVTTIGLPSAVLTNTGPVSFPITFTKADEVNLTPSDIILSKSGTANATISITNGTTTTPQVVFSNISGDGSLAFSINAGVARNSAGSSIASSPSQSVNVDNVKPVITLTSSQNGNLLNNTVPFVVTIDFITDNDALAVASSNLTLVNATVDDFSVNDGNSANITFTPLADGQVSITLAANQIVDAAGNGNDLQVVGFTYDNTKPTVVISTSKTTVNGAFLANFDFSEAVTGFDISDINVTNANLTNFSGSGANYTVTVTPLTESVVTLEVATDKAQDNATNGNSASNKLSVNYDTTAPIPSISVPITIQNTLFSVLISFNEEVVGFDINDIVVSNASLSNFTNTGSGNYTLDVTPISDGSVTIDIAEAVAQDAAGNNNTAATTAVINVDISAPSTVISVPSSPQTTAFKGTITFSESVVGFTQSDITTSNASLSDFTGSGDTYSVTVTPVSEGKVTLGVAANAAQDNAGNGNTASTTVTVDFDLTAPTVELATASDVIDGEFEVMVTFDEVITGLEISDFELENATVSSLTGISSTSFKLLIQPISSGQVSVLLKAVAVQDLAGNNNLVSNKLVVQYNNGLVSVSIKSPGKANNAFKAEFEFSGAVSGFDMKDILTSNADLSNFTTISSTLYAVEVDGISVGPITLSVPENVVLDEFGNGNAASSVITIDFDNIAPKPVTLTPTNNSELVAISTVFAITYDELILQGSGDIKLINIDDGTEMLAISKSVAGDSLEFEFADSLRVNAQYQVKVDKGVVVDLFENQSPPTTEWFFTTTNLAPVASDDSATTDEDIKVAIEITLNDSDSDNELDLSSVELSNAEHGSVHYIGNGIVEYIPNLDFNGTDSFTYTIADVAGLRSNQASVTINVSSINDAPKFISEPILNANALVEYIYNIEVSDVDSEDLTVSITNVTTLPEWLNLIGLQLIGTPPASAIGEEFNIILQVEDGELKDTQSFTLKIDEFDNSIITILQSVNVEQIIINQPFELTVKVSNESAQTVNVGDISIALSGAEVVEQSERCILVDQIFKCQPDKSLSQMDSMEFKFTLQAIEIGELNSNVTLTINEEISKQDSFAKNISENSSDESGEQLLLSAVNSLATADFNNDGLIDIVFAANQNSAVFLNKGAGQFELTASILSNENVLHVAVGDFNNDGFIDIAFATEGQLGSGVLYNSGNATFADIQIISKTPSKKVFAFDINHDTQTDIAYLDSSILGISIFTQPFGDVWQTQTVGFKVTENQVLYNDLASGDINNDGLVDLVLAVENDALEVWYQNANGDYNKHQTEIFNAQNVILTDLTGTGRLDIIALAEKGIAIMNSQNSEVNYISSVGYQAIDISNLHGDELLEIALLSKGGDLIIYTPTEEGYKPLPTVFEAADANGFVLTDVDMDGDTDMVISSFSGENEIRFNQGNGLFGQQTTDLSLIISNTYKSVTLGELVEFDIVIENNGLAHANNPKLLISIDNASIDSINSEKVTCIAESNSYICEHQGSMEVGDKINLSILVNFTSLGTAVLNAEVANERVDDDASNNMQEIAVNVVAKSIIEPPKKRSSGNLFYLLYFVLVIMIVRKRQTGFHGKSIC